MKFLKVLCIILNIVTMLIFAGLVLNLLGEETSRLARRIAVIILFVTPAVTSITLALSCEFETRG